MSNQSKGRIIRQTLLGYKSERPTAVLPATTQAPIFTVATGRVVVTSLIGEVTTATSATATNLSVTSNPTTGSDVVLASVAAVASKEVGSLFSMPLTFGGTLLVNNAGAGQVPYSLGFLVPVGTIDLITSATNTGAVKWTVTWYPLDDGATIAAA